MVVAYWVARSKVNDPERYKKYADLAPAIIGKFGGKFLARGGKFKILGEIPPLHRHRAPRASRRRSHATTRPSPLEAAAYRKKDGAGELEIVIVESI